MFDTLRTALARVREDVSTALDKDPAAKRPAQAALYPGLHAVWAHRVIHRVHAAGCELAAWTLAHGVRFLTGVEIHPDAEIGRRVFIDHGMGIVVGETAEIGDDVHMFHGVTLGGDDPRPVKRHPTVEDGATLGANSNVIGDVTIGEGAVVGAGAVVVEDVPAGATVVGNPAEIVDRDPSVPEEAADEPPAAGTASADEATVDQGPTEVPERADDDGASTAGC